MFRTLKILFFFWIAGQTDQIFTPKSPLLLYKVDYKFAFFYVWPPIFFDFFGTTKFEDRYFRKVNISQSIVYSNLFKKFYLFR